MSNSRIYKHYLYLAGVLVPHISDSISSQFGSLASANIELSYSPFILNIHEYTKIQIFEQIIDNGTLLEPTLEFDGIVIGITKNKNILGEVSARLTCLTDGVIWNQRKQCDFYLNQILDVDNRGTDTVQNMRADGSITNFFQEILQSNRFDIGCAVCSILTSENKAKTDNDNTVSTKYSYTYNGKLFFKDLRSDNGEAKSVNPEYYRKFLEDYHLRNKVYGISTSDNVKDFFQQDNFVKLITNNINDLQGENSFWTIASTVLQYGFYNLYDIPNPTFIPKGSRPDASGNDLKNILYTDVNDDPNKNQETVSSHPDFTTSLNTPDGKYDRGFNGLGEYLLKPISVLGIPYKCNVIWPDQVIQESLFYDFINSPTRVLYQQQALPGITDNVVLTTSMFVGPNYSNKTENYFNSYNTPEMKIGEAKVRPQIIYSDYEKEYGLRTHRLNLSYAFDATLLKDDKTTDTAIRVSKKLNNFLNYEFTQKFLSSRNYSLQVTPDVSIIAGMSTIVLNKEGQHIICFCTGIQKYWNTSGQKSVQLSVAYPRYYYENIGELGNIIDPVSQDQFAIKEMNTIIGSEPLDNLVVSGKVCNENLPVIVENLFNNYNANSDVSIIKSKYQRSVCSYKDFMTLHNKKYIYNFESEYQNNLFESTLSANKLSTHTFKVYQSGKLTEHISLSNREIIKKHIEWIDKDQRI